MTRRSGYPRDCRDPLRPAARQPLEPSSLPGRGCTDDQPCRACLAGGAASTHADSVACSPARDAGPRELRGKHQFPSGTNCSPCFTPCPQPLSTGEAPAAPPLIERYPGVSRFWHQGPALTYREETCYTHPLTSPYAREVYQVLSRDDRQRSSRHAHPRSPHQNRVLAMSNPPCFRRTNSRHAWHYWLCTPCRRSAAQCRLRVTPPSNRPPASWGCPAINVAPGRRRRCTVRH